MRKSHPTPPDFPGLTVRARDTLVIFVKEPRPGRVKTRLGAGIGLVPAAWWFRHQSQRLIRRLARDPRWRTVLAVSPDHEGLASRVWPACVARRPQGRGDLGDRMLRALAAEAPGRVMIVGSDIPDITPDDIAGGFRALGRCDAVFGPAEDGGYWLVGCRGAPPRGLFRGVRWSSEHTLADTLANLPGQSVGYLRSLNDVDEAGDL